MRSIKTMLLVAVTAMVAAAFVAPAVASASSWTKGGVELKAGEELVWSHNRTPFEGSTSGLLIFQGGKVAMESGNGNFNCEFYGYAELKPKGGSGNFYPGGVEGCEVTGALRAACGNNVTNVDQIGEPWSIHTVWSGGKPAFEVKDFDAIYHLQCGKEDFPVEFSGDLIFTPSDPNSIDAVSVSGTVDMTVQGEVWEQGTVSSSNLHNTWETGYGIGNAWIEGNIAWGNSSGGVICSVKSSVAFQAGSEGKLTSLDWDGKGCTLEGTMGSTCGVHGINSIVSNGLPWTIVNDGKSIKVKNASFTVDTVGSCPEEGTWKGELTAAPDKTSAISSTSLSSTLAGPEGMKRYLLGSLKWNPAGVYGF